MQLKLRDYQSKLMDDVRQAFANGYKSPCIVLGCGGGKTALFAYMAQHSQSKGKTIWFLVHRRELMAQTIATFERFNIPLDSIYIDMVQTVSRNLTKFPEPNFIIFDECHFSKAKTWQKIIDAFPEAFLAGLTATPSRLDNKPLGDIYDVMIQGPSARELIERKYLAPYRYFSHMLINPDVLKSRNGEYDQAECYELLGKSKIYGDVIKEWQTKASDKKTIVYCTTIKHSEEVASAFQDAGVSAVHFDGNTPTKKRDQIIADFREGKIQILCNVDLISVGFDCPDCDCCILLRPTKSTALHVQQACRALRPKEGKEAIIIDMVGNFTRHGLPDYEHEWSLDSKLKMPTEFNSDGLLSIRECESCFLCYETKKHNQCPFCGCMPTLKTRELENIKEIELQEIRDEEARLLHEKVKTYSSPDKCENMKELTEYGKVKGFKQGWRYHTAKRLGIFK